MYSLLLFVKFKVRSHAAAAQQKLYGGFFQILNRTFPPKSSTELKKLAKLDEGMLEMLLLMQCEIRCDLI